MTHRKDGSLPLSWKLILFLLPPLAALIALGIGRIGIAPGKVLSVLIGAVTGKADMGDLTARTVWNLRLPRILMAALVGSGLSTAGCAFQSLFANPLATPDTLGVASGASFGAALAILMGFPMIGIQAMALLLGLGAVTLTITGWKDSEGFTWTIPEDAWMPREWYSRNLLPVTPAPIPAEEAGPGEVGGEPANG